MSVRREWHQPGDCTGPLSDQLHSHEYYEAGCPDCGCTNPGCENGCRVSKIDEIHAWLSEVMPAARLAIKMMNARSQLMARWRGGKSAG